MPALTTSVYGRKNDCWEASNPTMTRHVKVLI